MSANLQSTVELYRLVNYANIILVTGVVYDYFITLSREVEYIWCKTWTRVSTLFVLVRYLGVCQALLVGNTAFPASVITYAPKMYEQAALLTIDIGTAFYLLNQYLLLLFNAAIDLVMIMRIYAMWNQSRLILGFLLCIYVPETVLAFVFASVFDNPNTYMTVMTTQILGASVCDISYNLPSPLWKYLTPTFTISAALSIPPIIQTLKQSVDMYNTAKKCQPNRYMKLLVRDGIFYFFVRSLYDIQWAIGYALQNRTNMSGPFTGSLSLMLLFSMLPRFIIDIREMYDRDCRNSRWQGVDTGFGIISRPSCENMTGPSVEFADVCVQHKGEVVEGRRTGDPDMFVPG